MKAELDILQFDLQYFYGKASIKLNLEGKMIDL